LNLAYEMYHMRILFFDRNVHINVFYFSVHISSSLGTCSFSTLVLVGGLEVHLACKMSCSNKFTLVRALAWSGCGKAAQLEVCCNTYHL